MLLGFSLLLLCRDVLLQLRTSAPERGAHGNYSDVAFIETSKSKSPIPVIGSPMCCCRTRQTSKEKSESSMRTWPTYSCSPFCIRREMRHSRRSRIDARISVPTSPVRTLVPPVKQTQTGGHVGAFSWHVSG